MAAVVADDKLDIREQDVERSLEQSEAQRNAAPADSNAQDPSSIAPLSSVVATDAVSASSHSTHEADAHALSASTSNGSGADDTDAKSTVTNEFVNAQHQTKWYKRSLNPLKMRAAPPVPSTRTISRENGAGFFSLLTFQWMAGIMSVGYIRPLELNDIWLVNPDRASDVLVPRMDANFAKRVAQGKQHAFLLALYDTFKTEFWIGGICSLAGAIFQVVSPFTTRYLIKFATEAYEAQHTGAPSPNLGHGLGLAIGITIMQVLQSLLQNQFLYRGMVMGGQARAVVINMVFEKSIKLSPRAKAGGQAIEGTNGEGAIDTQALKKQNEELLKQTLDANKKNMKHKPDGPPGQKGVSGDGTGWGNGRIVTLMSVDASRIDLACGFFHLSWTSPIIIVLVLVLLLVNIGPSALSGYALLILGTPGLTIAIKKLFRRRGRINKITDQRVSLTQEILSAVRFVKYFGWEQSFLERLNEIRKREIKAIQVLLSIRNLITAISMSLPLFASMLAFITYSLSKHDLHPALIFSSLALFNSLRMPLNMLPLVIGQVTDAWASIKRVQEFLLQEEMKEEVEFDKETKFAIEVKDAEFTWERTPSEAKGDKPAHSSAKTQDNDGETHTPLKEIAPFKLSDVSFTAGRDELIAVIGSVGSGKTSLLAGLAGDMRRISGTVKMGDVRAFCPQYAWIQNASVRDNILFGKDYDEDWYQQVVTACALKPDFDMLPAGDETEVGDRGINLSGGQKQRLNIARAIYFNAGVVLLDDPLSAVDAHTGKIIMDQAICGLLKGKCRILATHQLHVLNRCDRVMWMHEGKIKTIDTFANLMAESEEFQKLMATTSQEGRETETTDEEGSEASETKEARTAVAEAPKKKNDKKAGILVKQEERAQNSVKWSVYKAYLDATGSGLYGILILLVLFTYNTANIVTSLYLSWWTSGKYGLTEGQYIGGYVGLGIFQALMMFTFATALSVCGTNASKNMLRQAMYRCLRAPLSFFDQTPLGRITNRFSKDIDVMDNNLTDAIRMFGLTITMIVAVFALIIVYFYYFAIALAPLAVVFFLAAGFYRASARELKRHEAVLRSIVFAKFSEAVTGTASIRAYGVQDQFVRRIRESIDIMNGAYFLTFSNQRWLSIRLDAVGNLLVLTTGILVVTSRFNVAPSISGLVLSYILALIQVIQFSVRQLAEVENNMNSTERIHYYATQLDEEAPTHLQEMDPAWPQSGHITFDKVQMRYRAGLPLVLQDLTLDVQGGERIGIVGRTGAGKSSILSALFRLTELSGGRIEIDRVDIGKVGLHDLRTRLAIIPQDPTLFRGTIRSNLDPFGEHTDVELWTALKKSGLVNDETPSSPANTSTSSSTRASLSEKRDEGGSDDSQTHRPAKLHLSTPVEEEGLNFSLGQRQLMALARALVRNARIIVCDEATSSVDFETDARIQRTMATQFAGRTVLCIAHRLKTIIGYDRVVVMDKGSIREVGSPAELFDRKDVFWGMCERSGIGKEEILRAEKGEIVVGEEKSE